MPKKTKKGPGRPKKTKTLKFSLPGTGRVREKQLPDGLYPLEEMKYERQTTKEMHERIVKSAERMYPGQAFFVPKSDIGNRGLSGFAQSARKAINDHRTTKSLNIKTSVITTPKVQGVRFYCIPK